MGDPLQAKAEVALVSEGHHLVPPSVLMDYLLDIGMSMVRVERCSFKIGYAHRRVSPTNTKSRYHQY